MHEIRRAAPPSERPAPAWASAMVVAAALAVALVASDAAADTAAAARRAQAAQPAPPAPALLEPSAAAPSEGSSSAAGDGSGAPARAELRLEPRVSLPNGSESAVGAPANATLEVELPPGAELISVDVEGSRFVSVVDGTVTSAAGASAARWEGRLVSFRPGTFASLRLVAVVVDASGYQSRAPSPAFGLDVRSTIVNESAPEPAPSSDPMDVRTRDPRPTIAAAIAGVLALGAVVGWVVRRRRDAARPAEPDAPRRPAWEVALAALDVLALDDLPSRGEQLDFMTRLSEILREYIGARFRFLALEATTTEIGRELDARSDEVGLFSSEIRALLSEMDLVKFARFTPPTELCDELLERTRRLVTELSARERELSASGGEAGATATPGGEATARVDAPAGPHAVSPPPTTAASADRTDDSDDGTVVHVDFRPPPEAR
ncbi:MAG: hypothetical protein H6698_00175 [Myxococcales bacterium]|nr:hypothetical protein [Myxococcales bacterium]MCB9532727.1 hypothetical protein [Myxococcales bacterium]